MSRSRGETPFTTSPPMAMAPEVGSSSPATIRRAVVFPHADGPTRTMNSPSAMVQVSASTAVVPFGKPFVTSWNETSATIMTSRVRRRDSRQHDRASQVLRTIGIETASLGELDGHPLDEDELGHRIRPLVDDGGTGVRRDRKSTRLNSSHRTISYADFCLKKKKKNNIEKINKNISDEDNPKKEDEFFKFI